MNKTFAATRPSRAIRIGACAGILFLTSCASTPPPTASIDAARSAIASAEKADAGQYAAAELTQARDQLAAAETAAREERMTPARQLADQATAEANLANARAAEAKAVAVNNEMKTSNAALGDELQRAAGDHL